MHARELAFQIKREYDRFAKYFPWVKIGVVFGGIDIKKDREMLNGILFFEEKLAYCLLIIILYPWGIAKVRFYKVRF